MAVGVGGTSPRQTYPAYDSATASMEQAASSFKTGETPGDSLSSSIRPDAASLGVAASSFEADETPGEGAAASMGIHAMGSIAPKDEAVISRDVAGSSKDVAALSADAAAVLRCIAVMLAGVAVA